MSIFQFKEFSVEQSRSPAKITTDATLFASSLCMPNSASTVLEVGTGTGVLSLMLAQRFGTIEIDAVEINPDAFEEGTMNFKNSKWNARLKVFFEDFNEFKTEHLYDVIFSNPPFFQNNLQSDVNQGKNMAYHTGRLSLEALAKGIERNLSWSGEAHIMLPPYEMSCFEKEIQALGFQCKRSIELRHKAESKVIRLFNVFDRSEASGNFHPSQIYIRDENNSFHPLYINLMKDFLTIF